MPINTYDETHASDYLDQQRIELAKLRAQKIGSSVIIPGFILPLDDTVNLSDTLATPTDIAKGTYEVLGDETYQPLWLSFDSDVIDKSGNNNNGAISGVETYVAGPGVWADLRYNKAFSFDGATNITFNDTPFDFERTAPFSITYWKKQPTNAATYAIISKRSSDTANGWSAQVDSSGHEHFRLMNTNTTNELDVKYAVDLADDVWRHFGWTYSGNSLPSGVKLYTNGTSQSLTTVTNNLSATILNNTILSVGGHGSSNRLPANTLLKDVQVWNIELTAAQVLTLSEGRQISNNAIVSPIAFLNLCDWGA